MGLANLRIMWCCIICAVFALLYIPHVEDVTQAADSKDMTPLKVERVHYYVGIEMLIVCLFMAGGAITIRNAVMRVPDRKLKSSQFEGCQEDAKPAEEPPLLVLTDERGKFVV